MGLPYAGHLCEQVLTDIENSLECLSSRGCIVLHDCLPKEETQQLRVPISEKAAWTGDVWKAVAKIRSRDTVDTAVLDSDWGLGIILPRPNTAAIPPISDSELTWSLYREQHKRLLRVLNVGEMIRFVEQSPVERTQG